MDRLAFPIISVTDSKLPFYVKSVGIRERQEHVIRPQGHPEYHYLHCSSGKGRLIINNQDFALSPGTGFFFEPHIPHEYYSLEDPWKTYWITFEGYAVKELCKAVFENSWNVFSLSDHHELENQLDNICQMAQSQNYLSNENLSVLLYQFLILLKVNITNNVFASKPLLRNQLQTVIQYIENNFDSSISLDELAGVINISPQHLCRLFKQTYNMRPFEYLTYFRIKRAKELLTNSQSYSVKTIAGMVGYNDTSYFCSTFKEYEGCSPMEFRKIFCK